MPKGPVGFDNKLDYDEAKERQKRKNLRAATLRRRVKVIGKWRKLGNEEFIRKYQERWAREDAEYFATPHQQWWDYQCSFCNRPFRTPRKRIRKIVYCPECQRYIRLKKKRECYERHKDHWPSVLAHKAKRKSVKPVEKQVISKRPSTVIRTPPPMPIIGEPDLVWTPEEWSDT